MNNTTEWSAGYASGIRDTQPNWISTAEHSPEKSDYYWAIGEFTEDYSDWKKGDLILETCTPYAEGIWPLEEIPIRILYWAERRRLLKKKLRKLEKEKRLANENSAARPQDHEKGK